MSASSRRIIFWSCSAMWAGFIFFMSSIPGSKIPGIIPAEVAHFSEYLVLGVLLYLALSTDLPAGRALVLALVLASMYGVSDEFHQRFVVLRTPDVRDWAMDTVGAMAGAAAAKAGVMTRSRWDRP